MIIYYFKKDFKVVAYISLYLSAIASANLLASRFGPDFSIINAFLFIGFDITCRDFLHEKWQDKQLFLRMFVLISVGSIISYLINRSSGQIALASGITFLIVSGVDYLVYQILINKIPSIKVNTSNVFSAVIDSMIFPTLAFGTFLPYVTVLQIFAKMGGGILWFYILSRHLNLKRISVEQ